MAVRSNDQNSNFFLVTYNLIDSKSWFFDERKKNHSDGINLLRIFTQKCYVSVVFNKQNKNSFLQKWGIFGPLDPTANSETITL